MLDRGYARVPRNDRYNPNRQYRPEEYTDPPYVDQSERQPERYQPPPPPPPPQPLQAPPPPPPHRQSTSDKPNIAPRIEPVDAVEELGLPRHSSGYSHVTFDESAMLEVMANIKDDVYAAEKRKRGTASASGTDAGRARKQQVVSNASEPLIMPETPMPPPPPPHPSAAPFVPLSNPLPIPSSPTAVPPPPTRRGRSFGARANGELRIRLLRPLRTPDPLMLKRL
jgi:hypothetical protein